MGTPHEPAANMRNYIRLALEEGPMNVIQVARDISRSESAAHNYLKSLVRRGHVRYENHSPYLYHLTPQSALEPWEGHAAVRRVVMSSDDWMTSKQIAEAANESVRLARRCLAEMVRDGLAVRCTANRPSIRYARLSVAARTMEVV